MLFTTGCNFRCSFCHNSTLLGTMRQGLPWERLQETCRQFRAQWVDGAVISGGEPTLWGKELARLIRCLKDAGLAVKLDTNGSRPDVLEEILPELDYVAMDLKCRLQRYPEFVGFHNHEAIASSIELIRQSGCRYEFRTTIIDGIHSEQEAAAMAETVKGARRYVLQPFLPREDLPDPVLRKTPRTSSEDLLRLRDVMQTAVAEVVIKGT